MTRSSRKGPYIDANLLKKVLKQKETDDRTPIKTWARSCQISPDFVGSSISVYNGRKFIDVFITESMVGHRLGEFSLTKKFIRHGGKIQKELEQKQKEAEIAAAQAAKATVTGATTNADAPKK